MRLAYLPLFVRDFLTDPNVLQMRWLDQAIYLRMLMASWEAGPLPDDVNMIGRLIDRARLEEELNAYGADFNVNDAIQGVLDVCWRLDESGWTNPRLEHERQYGLVISQSNSERTARGWETRRSRCSADAQHVLSNASQAQAQARKKKEEPPRVPPPGGALPSEKKPKPGKKASKPVWCGELPAALQSPRFQEVWARWILFRSAELRKPVTQLSGDQSLRELSGWGLERAVRAIEHTIARGWQGIREPEPARNGHASASEYLAEQSNLKTLKELGLA